MSRSIIAALLCCIFMAGAVSAEKPEVISQIRLKPMTKQQFLDMRLWGLDIKQTKDGELEVFAKPGDLQRLRRAGIQWDVVHDDVQEFYETRAALADFGGFETYSQIVQHLDNLALSYPNITTEKFSIGLSIYGNDQWVIKVSDNPDIDEDEPEVFYNSLIHSREPAAAASLMHFLEYLLSNYGVDPEVTDIIDNRELFFLPVVNPDGYLYNEEIAPNGGGMWRKNRLPNGDGTYGVDLNRNFSYMWGFDNIGSSPYTYSETYRGVSGFSEPETQNLRDFIISRDFTIVHNLHCYSNLELWAPCYRRFYDPQEDFFSNLGDSLTQYNDYTPNVGWHLYPTNGDADDWIWGDTDAKPQIISLTAEIGTYDDGFWPSPARIPVLVEENIWPNFYLAKIADNPYLIAPPKTPSISSPAAAGADFTVTFSVDDDINPPSTYRLTEYTGKQQYTDDAEADYGYWDQVRMELSSVRSNSGSYSWHMRNANRDHHWLLSKTPYEVKTDDELTFWIWFELEDHYDYFYAQISTDGGYTYDNLPCIWSTNDDPHNINLGNGMTGSSGGWVRADFDLSAYEGMQVLFRLAMFTDDYTYYEGVYIDDIENVEMFQASTEISSSITDPYYDFAGKANGEYWYRVTATDAQGQESRLSPYTHTVVSSASCCVISGDVDHNGQVDALDLTHMVNWMWKGGPGIPCPEEADVNGDLQVDALDIVHLVNYFWKSGPAPVACHPL